MLRPRMQSSWRFSIVTKNQKKRRSRLGMVLVAGYENKQADFRRQDGTPDPRACLRLLTLDCLMFDRSANLSRLNLSPRRKSVSREWGPSYLSVAHVRSNEGGGCTQLAIGKKLARTYSRPEHAFFVAQWIFSQAEPFFRWRPTPGERRRLDIEVREPERG
jgi:hypothetical protein